MLPWHPGKITDLVVTLRSLLCSLVIAPAGAYAHGRAGVVLHSREATHQDVGEAITTCLKSLLADGQITQLLTFQQNSQHRSLLKRGAFSLKLEFEFKLHGAGLGIATSRLVAWGVVWEPEPGAEREVGAAQALATQGAARGLAAENTCTHRSRRPPTRHLSVGSQACSHSGSTGHAQTSPSHSGGHTLS